MSDEHSHNNPWANKLQNLGVPDVNDNWNNMQALLDSEMPVAQKNSNLKWLLLLLLLLLLVLGICNCPGLRRGNKFSKKDGIDTTVSNTNQPPSVEALTDTITVKSGDQNFIEPRPVPGETDNLPPGTAGGKRSNPLGTVKDKPRNGKQLHLSSNSNDAGDHPLSQKPKRNRTGITQRNKAKQNGYKTIPGSNAPDKSLQHGYKRAGGNVEKIAANNRNKPANKSDSINPTIDRDTGNIRPGHQPSDTAAPAKPGLNHVIDTSKQADSVPAKLSPADSTAKEKERGFVVAIGLNQFLPIGEQEHSSYNSSGTSGVLADYIPIPQLRYHVNRKLYMQIEAQFNAPQYTGNVLARESPPDSSRPGPPLQQSVYIRKLFYFNLPFSVYYSPVKNFYLGTGLQFSQLKNAVGLYSEKRLGSALQDTGNTVKFQSLKSDDTTYSLLKTNEWRFLVDANYHWKRLTLGLRYNQALNYFINEQISGSVITQARNNSLQLYLRYDIWDRRKKLPATRRLPSAVPQR